MKKQNLILIVVILVGIRFNQTTLQAQQNKAALSYVDSIVNALNIKTIQNPDDLAFDLAEPFETDSEKVRAIFYWITQNIAYDYKAFLEKHYLQYKGEELDAYYYKRIYKTLMTKKGVCEDYALVFQYLCKKVKIQCKMITGYGLVERPTKFLQFLLSEQDENHAWNAVYLNKEWYLLDVTFASGEIDSEKHRFVRHLNNFYYLTPPEKFILDHHPSESYWQLLSKPLNIKEFIENARKNSEQIIRNRQ